MIGFPAPGESITPLITSHGKDQNSKLEVQFLLNVYSLHTTLKLKNYTFNHCKSGTTNNLLKH